MSLDRRFFRPLGALCILASDPMIEAGAMAAGSFAQEGDYFRLVVSGLSIVAAVPSRIRRISASTSTWTTT